MYSASATFLTKVKSNIRKFSWSGTITTSGGNTYTFTNADIVGGGSITRSISSQTLNIGTAYASTFSIELVLAGVSRYELFGAEVSVSCSIDGASDVIPMGVFTVSEATQTADHISIKAYDNMVKFDAVSFAPGQHVTIQKPSTWLSEMCTACGVSLGSSVGDIEGLPNGTRKTGFADVVADVKTWRDVLEYLAAYLGAFAYIGRDGALYLKTYKSASDDTIPASFRYSSGLSDYRTTFDGLYSIYKGEGVQEYVSNTNTGGLVLDLGANPFLQITVQGNRLDALQEIIDVWNGVYYVPFNAEMPLVPTYDPGDVLKFTDNQAATYDRGAITSITYNIGGNMSVVCTGDNPILADAQDRFSKTVAGLSADYNSGAESGGKNFWLLHTENTSALSVPSGTKTEVAEIEWTQTVDVQRMGFMFTCEATLTDTANALILITVDDDATYEFDVEDKELLGKRVLTSTCGFRVTGKTSHVAKVYLTITDNALKWNELA